MMAPPRLVLLLGLLDLAVSPPSPDYSRDPVRHPPHPSRRRAVEWKKINILHLTDVHSFIAGNRHEGIDTDYGDLVSFVHHMHQRAAERGVDLFVVNTGDIVDGTGMSDATPIAGEFLTPILQRIPYDGFTIGNHELYEDSTVENLRRPGGFLEHFGAVVVTSNQLDASRQPMGVRFNVLRGANGGTLLVFGFLFDWDGFCPNECFVQDVGLAVAEPWFVEAVRAHAAEADGVMVMAHMGWSDPAIETIRAAVRGALDGGGGGGDATAAADPLPLVFLAGHTHIRRFARLDDHAAVLESGRYFDTIGLLSFDAAAANDDTATAKGVAALGRGHGGGAPAITWFEYQYLATTLADFHAASGTDAVSFPTSEGLEVRAQIQEVREAFALDEVLGCTPAAGPTRYRRAADLSAPDSLWLLALTEVIPATVFLGAADTHRRQRQAPQILLAGTGGLRFDVFAGEVTRDDTMIVSPFRDRFWAFDGLSAAEAQHVIELLGAAVPGEPRLPGMVATSSPLGKTGGRGGIEPAPETEEQYSVLALDYDLSKVRDAVREATLDPGRTELPYRHDEGLDTTVIWELFVKEQWASNCARHGGGH